LDLDIDILSAEFRISCKDYESVLKSNVCHILLDVRDNLMFEISALENSYSTPLS
jgi:hypothetical protein